MECCILFLLPKLLSLLFVAKLESAALAEYCYTTVESISIRINQAKQASAVVEAGCRALNEIFDIPSIGGSIFGPAKEKMLLLFSNVVWKWPFFSTASVAGPQALSALLIPKFIRCFGANEPALAPAKSALIKWSLGCLSAYIVSTATDEPSHYISSFLSCTASLMYGTYSISGICMPNFAPTLDTCELERKDLANVEGTLWCSCHRWSLTILFRVPNNA